MNYDVFVSHSSRDQRAVEAICTRLEAQGITCFVSYRDAEKGGAWARTIAEALENSRMMLVVASENFNSSRQTDREVGIAGEKDPPMPMLVFRLSDAKFEGVKHYYLNNLNWINAFPDPTKHFRELYDTVQNMLAKEALSKNRISAATAQAQTQTQIPRTKAVAKNDKNVLKIAAAAGAVLLTAVVAVVCFVLAGTPVPESEFAEVEGDFVGGIVPAPAPTKQEKFESEPEPALPKVDVKPVEPVPPKVDVKPVEPVPEKPKTEQPVKIVNDDIPVTLRFRGKEWQIGKYEVTQKQYEFIMKENPSEHKGEDLPVENVSVEKAKEYCDKLTAFEQKKNPKIRYRLPTVEEWEYACSVGIKDWKYIKNQDAKLAEFGHIKTFGGPKLIGQKKAKYDTGPYDLVGNVREICVDKDGGYVALGGSYLYGIEEKGCGTQFPDIGFRIVREEIPEKVFPNIPETVQIPGKDWKIGKYEVTEEQYEFIMKKNPSKSKKRAGKNFPVDNVSAADAREYCRKLTEYARKQPAKDGGIDEDYKFDIPTRDEWEYACRAGTETEYHFGKSDSYLKNYAWYRGNSGKEKHPVGKKKPNNWEIYDMHGNAAELCQWFNEKIYLRGGSFAGSPDDLRINSAKEGKKGGLRVVLVPDYPKVDDNSVSEEARKAVVPETVGIKDKNWRIGKYEVTQKQYESVMGENPSKLTRGETCPVTHVTWTDAVKYCKKLTDLAREKDEISQIMEFRLPTLEEWKYCAGEGKEDMDDAAWYVGNSDKKVHPVGGKKANALGIFDMHGNVSEFCYDGGKGWRIGGNYVKAKDYCANFAKTTEALKESEKEGYIGFRIILGYREGFEPKPLLYPAMVTVSEGWGKKWQIGKYEVTQREYESVMRMNPSEHKGDDLPVENVTWAEAEQYCRRLTRFARNAKKIEQNQEYRLPTFKEWEYACRAGTKANYWSGLTATDLARVGWYEKNSGKKTHPVGERDKIGNEFGLCDVHGNVAEWCKDASLRDPSKRIFRGGAYDSSAEECDFFHVGEAYFRDDRKPNVGFRVVLVNTDN